MRIIVYISVILLLGCHSSGEPEMVYLKQLDAPHTRQMGHNNWTIGCEVLDRGYAHYNHYKTYLDSLGCKTARLQSGWAKTEQAKGVYDFQWLDEIVDDLVERAIRPWLQLSYGNPIYPGGGEAGLGASLPHSEEALLAWDNWVRSMVQRYHDKVNYWEIWNEPNLKGLIAPDDYAEFYVRTAQVIRTIQPQARLSALALSGLGEEYALAFFHHLDSMGGLSLVDEVTFHPYHKQPEVSNHRSKALIEFVGAYGSGIGFKQGENGAPSTVGSSGALSSLAWNENRQAKWLLRRMMSDLGHDIPSSVFTIIDFAYPADQHLVGWNTKGILKADTATGMVAYKKPAFRAVQHVTATFNQHIKRIPGFTYDVKSDPADRFRDSIRMEIEPFSLFAYEDNRTGMPLVVCWLSGLGADQDADIVTITLLLDNFRISKPVLVDLLDGRVYEMHRSMYKKTRRGMIFNGIRVSDWPIVIADQSFVGESEK